MTRQEFKNWLAVRLSGNITDEKIPHLRRAEPDLAISICVPYSIEQLMDYYIEDCMWASFSCTVDGLTRMHYNNSTHKLVTDLIDISTAWANKDQSLFYSLLQQLCGEEDSSNKPSIF